MEGEVTVVILFLQLSTLLSSTYFYSSFPSLPLFSLIVALLIRYKEYQHKWFVISLSLLNALQANYLFSLCLNASEQYDCHLIVLPPSTAALVSWLYLDEQ